MNIRFTIEEENIIAIYAEDSRERTIDNINSAMPYMDEDMRQLAAAAVNKLQAMTDSAFSVTVFTLTDDE
ncbi:transposon-transfer assisting family protein [[Ruminococcus] torques]|uniref:transposon-transfer assisting family protein n=1 Tax=[Ruminococcus] torques TaxID=33039 RepID=UPI001D07209E|nr:transposon-transfer assisting family protein [[Ruminococcus] torques]MCB6637592.1 transposon-transfer assisting family protein [[Ruminococcus] torques]MCB7324841.1 transposon-transfer assisting family protein [[Ruminococcus] torques]